jgi:hypothetical protein
MKAMFEMEIEAASRKDDSSLRFVKMVGDSEGMYHAFIYRLREADASIAALRTLSEQQRCATKVGLESSCQGVTAPRAA